MPITTLRTFSSPWAILSLNFWISVLTCVKVAQSCLTLCDHIGYTVHGILQARILGWVAVPFSRGSSQAKEKLLHCLILPSIYFKNRYITEAFSENKKIGKISWFVLWGKKLSIPILDKEISRTEKHYK